MWFTQFRSAAPFGRHVGALFILLAIVLVPRMLAMFNAAAPARDAFRYWSAAACIDEFPLWRAVQWIDCQPLYPMTLSWLPGAGYAGDPETGWRVSQFWSIACYCWFIAAAYVVGLRLFSPGVAWLGCVLASLLPRQIRYSIDVLSDNLNAALWMTALALLVWFWPAKSKWSPAMALLAGVVTGLAAWTRFESVLLPTAFVAAMVVCQILPRCRVGGWHWALSMAAYLTPIVVAIGWYTLLRGEVSARPTVATVLAATSRSERAAGRENPLSRLEGARNAPMAEEPRTPIDAWSNGAPSRVSPQAIGGALGRTAWEFFQETRVWVGVLAFAGVFVGRRRDRNGAVELLIGFVLLGCACLMFLARWKAGFVAGRYMMPVVPLIAMYAGAAIARVWGTLRARSGIARPDEVVMGQGLPFGLKGRGHGGLATAWAFSVALIGIGASLSGWLTPLHADRHGHREAAKWIAEHAAPQERVFDPSCVCGYFADRPLWHPIQQTTPDCRYAVIEPVVAARPPAHLSEAVDYVAQHGRIVAEFRQRPGSEKVGVRIVELPNARRLAAEQLKGSRFE